MQTLPLDNFASTHPEGVGMAGFRLDGKTAVVTGASGGLGAHFAKVLAANGAKVILTARREAQLEEQVAAIRAAGGAAHAISMDVSDPESIESAFDLIYQNVGCDIVINNAGAAHPPRKLLDTSDEDWKHLLDVNLSGPWRVAREVAQRWVSLRKPGSIVNVGSIYSVRTGALKVAYNVSKAGVLQLTRSMAVELIRHGIRVNALCPGWFLTSINSDYFSTDAGKRYVHSIPMRRLGRLEELDAPLLLLASDAGSYITGAELVVDGGIAQSPI